MMMMMVMMVMMMDLFAPIGDNKETSYGLMRVS